MPKDSDEKPNKKPTSAQKKEARKLTKDTRFFKEPLQKSSFFQRVGAFFNGKREEWNKNINPLFDTLKGSFTLELSSKIIEVQSTNKTEKKKKYFILYWKKNCVEYFFIIFEKLFLEFEWKKKSVL